MLDKPVAGTYDYSPRAGPGRPQQNNAKMRCRGTTMREPPDQAEQMI